MSFSLCKRVLIKESFSVHRYNFFNDILKFIIKKKHSKENSLKKLVNNWDFKTELSGNYRISQRGFFE